METALRRIVLQLSAQSPRPYDDLEKLCTLSNGQALPNYHDLTRVLYELLEKLGRTYIVLDALDECQDSELQRLRNLISTLRGWRKINLHLLITSQPRATFADWFQDVPCVFLESNVTQLDIQLYISRELRDNYKLRMWASRVDDIVDRVAQRASGMSVLHYLLSNLAHHHPQVPLGSLSPRRTFPLQTPE